MSGRIAGGDELEGPGSTSWIEVADQPFPANTPFTLETWVYPFSTRAEYVGLLTKGRTGVDPYWVGLWLAPGNVLSFGWGWDVGQSGNLEGTTTLPPNQWHHIAAVFDGTTQRLYDNGAPDPGSTPQTNFYDDIPELSRIGGAANSQYLDGWMDEARISRVARSADWIQTSYNSMSSPGTFFSVGAEESGPYPWPLAVNIRSIGTAAGTLYSVGNASIGIGGTIVTFAGGASLPRNVGAGDELVIGGETFFIRSRDSATQVTVQAAATANHSSEAYTIARAFTTLQAVGRLPAANAEEVRAMVRKILAFEREGRGLEGPAVLVADDPDEAGDFEANAEAIASGPLAGLDVRRIYLRERGAAMTSASIVEAFDEGAGLLSYVGHGGIALWASEAIFDNAAVESLAPQPAQPLVITLNCLNGYFHFPYFDSLGEALVKADAKGAIAAISPSGLSLDRPAHLFHRDLSSEIASGRHLRIGDAFLAAQASYAASGAFRELLLIYHLFGDPALSLR